MSTAFANPTRTRIAHVSLGLEMGGMEKLLVEFARHANRERFQLHFICLEGHGNLTDICQVNRVT